MDDKIAIPATNTALIEHVQGGIDYIYLRSKYLRIISKGTLNDLTDPAVKKTKTYEYDLVIPKDKISLIEFGWHAEREAWQIVVVSGEEGNQLTMPDREFGKDLQNKLITWLFNLE